MVRRALAAIPRRLQVCHADTSPPAISQPTRLSRRGWWWRRLCFAAGVTFATVEDEITAAVAVTTSGFSAALRELGRFEACLYEAESGRDDMFNEAPHSMSETLPKGPAILSAVDQLITVLWASYMLKGRGKP